MASLKSGNSRCSTLNFHTQLVGLQTDKTISNIVRQYLPKLKRVHMIGFHLHEACRGAGIIHGVGSQDDSYLREGRDKLIRI